MAKFLNRIEEIEERARDLEARIADPELARQPGQFQKVAKALGGLRPLLEKGEEYRSLIRQLEDSRLMTEDPDAEVAEMARGETVDLEARQEVLESDLAFLLMPRDPNDEKNAIFEIRAGTGGDEAALFAAALFRMYCRYAEGRGWKVEQLSASETPGGGFKEVIALIDGNDVWSRLKFERGVHRVQRVPTTEAQGRIHTSTVTVAVMPEAEEVDIDISPVDLRIDVMRASGPGGQSVNTTDSAVRITHLPTGVVVQCQNERSQHKNKAHAMKLLQSRLYEEERRRREEAAQVANAEKADIGWGSQIRSYVLHPYRMVKDLRTEHEVSNPQAVLDGKLQPFIEAYLIQFGPGAQTEDDKAF